MRFLAVSKPTSLLVPAECQLQSYGRAALLEVERVLEQGSAGIEVGTFEGEV